jgi:adenylate cyclase
LPAWPEVEKRSGGAVMRLLSDIRFGTEHYTENVARRLRTVNIGTRIAAAAHAFFAALALAFFRQFWWMAITHAVATLVYAGIPLLHRVGPKLGGAVALVFLYIDILFNLRLIGTGSGIQFYFLLAGALAVLYFGPEQLALTASSWVLTTTLMVVAQLALPDDTGLLPWPLMVTALVSNAAVSCGSLLLIATYTLGEAEREYDRSERLLSNILPGPIATRLKNERNLLIADRHDDASILFADMEGFTAQASNIAPDELVHFLNRIFSDFDRLVERHGLEKIKTTGDAYMVVSGVPTPRYDHAQALAALAIEMRDVSAKWRDARGHAASIRLGISSGPVVAGVVGTRKFFYDVWGDAVNVAARMETTGAAGKIQVSQDSYERLRHDFELEPRGEIDIKGKGKGKMATWFLLDRKGQLTSGKSWA